MNEVVLIGNLTKDPEVRYSTGNNPTAICRFVLAVNDKRKNPQTGQYEDSPSFIPIVIFGKQAENCQKFLGKGSKCAIKGRIQTGSYEKNGQKVYTTEVIANGIEFLTPKQNNQQTQQSQGFNQEPQGFDDTPPGFNQMAEQEQIPF